MKDVDIQHRYYTETAEYYDDLHGAQDNAQMLGLHLLASYIEFYKISSVLDVGAGTGRALLWLKRRFPDIIVKGIEPVEALRRKGIEKGIPEGDLIRGDIYALDFPDNDFDLVCEFAVLHHVRYPRRAVREMSRVARRMISISDCNFLGQGSRPMRWLKAGLYLAGLWGVANWLKTRGKGYTFSENDGLAYSYSVFEDVHIIRQRWNIVRIHATEGWSDNVLTGSVFSAAHLLVVGIDKRHR